MLPDAGDEAKTKDKDTTPNTARMKGWAKGSKTLWTVMLGIGFPEKREHKSLRNEKELMNMSKSSYIF